MKFTILDSDRTNNFTDPHIESKIKTLWEKNHTHIQECLKEGITIVCLYHDYQSNYKGDYTVSLGKEDNDYGIFNTSNYEWREFKVNSADPLGVINTWKKIWLAEDNQEINRVYDFDFEQYSPNGQISIFVAIK